MPKVKIDQIRADEVSARFRKGYLQAHREHAYKTTATHLFLSPNAKLKIDRTFQPWHKRIARPGDWLAHLIFVVTLGISRPCAQCKSRMAAMNKSGWRGLPMLLAKAIRRRALRTVFRTSKL